MFLHYHSSCCEAGWRMESRMALNAMTLGQISHKKMLERELHIFAKVSHQSRLFPRMISGYKFNEKNE